MMNAQKLAVVEQVPCGLRSGYLLEDTGAFKVIRELYHIIPMGYDRVAHDNLPLLRDCMFTIQVTDQHYFIFLTKIQNVNCCLLLSRSDKTQQLLDCAFADELYTDTLVSGEICGGYFLCDDCLVLKGDPAFYHHKNLVERRHVLTDIMRNKRQPNQVLDQFVFVQKPYLQLEHLRHTKEINQDLSRFDASKFRSLIFTPTNFGRFPVSYVYHMDHTELRPNNQKPTVDPHSMHCFTLTKDAAMPDVYVCKIGIDGKVHNMGHALILSKADSLCLRDVHNDGRDHVWLCSFDRSYKKWRPLRHMSDRREPDNFIEDSHPPT